MMPRNRRTPTTTNSNPTAGVTNVEEALRLQCLASPDARLVQCCYVDHAQPQFASPHIHLQLLFSDRSRTPWFDVSACTVQDLQTALNNRGGRVRLHLHEQNGDSAAPNGGAANATVVGALPRCKLSAAGACRLAADGLDACPYCLEGFAAKEEVIIMPCGHVAHAPCTLKWLKTASTCPTCRYALPKAPTASEIEKMLGPARREQKRIEEARMTDEGISTMICQEVEADEDALPEAWKPRPPPQAIRSNSAADRPEYYEGGNGASSSASPITTSDSPEMTPPTSRMHSRPLSPPMRGPTGPPDRGEIRRTPRTTPVPVTQIAAARPRGVRSGLGTITRRLFHLGPRRQVASSSSA